MTKLDYDAANRDRDASFHVVAGKVAPRCRRPRSRWSGRGSRTSTSRRRAAWPRSAGTIVVMAFNPATQETLTYVFPSPGQAASAARVTFVSKGGQSVTVTR